MKKLITLLASLILVTSVAFGEESTDTVQESNTTSTETSVGGVQESSMGQGTGSLSRGDSFMTAIGMADSSIVPGGEVGGSAQTAVAVSTGSNLASQGTNPGHTPYVFTN